MLTGEVIFTNRDHPDYRRDPRGVIFELSSKCNLDVVEKDEQWRDVGQRPKDFIKRLLVLDETKRMDVKQALAHSWFTHRSYAKEFEEVYHKAISNWRPHKQTPNLVEALDPGQLLTKVKSAPFSNKHAYEASSRFFGPKSAKHSQAHAVFMRKRSLNAANFPRIAEEDDGCGQPKISLENSMVTSSQASSIVQPPVTDANLIQGGISQLTLSQSGGMASSPDPIQTSEHSLDPMNLSAVAPNNDFYDDESDNVRINATPTPCPSPTNEPFADTEDFVPETPGGAREADRKRSGNSMTDEGLGPDHPHACQQRGLDMQDASFRQAKRLRVT